MRDTAIAREKWERFFPARNRIAANFVADHPEFPAHDHAFIEIQLTVAGTCLQRSPLGESRPAAGDVFLFRPGAWHAVEQMKGLDLYNCCFDSTLLARELAWMIDDSTFSALLWSIPLSPGQHGMVMLHLPSRDVRACRNLLDALCRVSKRASGTVFAEQLGLLLQILGILGRHVPPDQIRSAAGRPHAAVATAIRLIDERPADEWTLASLAGRVHVAPTYFVLTGRRVELAACLLRDTALPVSEIGTLVGWPDANQFSRRFRCRLGLSPTRYRQRHTAVVEHLRVVQK
jgi:AraC family L-rhamnose operon transcriptional activator RhaR